MKDLQIVSLLFSHKGGEQLAVTAAIVYSTSYYGVIDTPRMDKSNSPTLGFLIRWSYQTCQTKTLSIIWRDASVTNTTSISKSRRI